MDDDADLVRRTLAGDTSAFGLLYDRYARVVRAICFDATQDLQQAQDLAQDAFLRAYTQLATLRKTESFAAWLVSMAKNVCREWKRSRRRDRHRYVGATPEPVCRPREFVAEAIQELRLAVAKLPEQERLALHLLYLQENSAEVARGVLGLSNAGFRKALKYESCRDQRRERRAVWLNSTTGLPIQSATFIMNPDGTERLESLYDLIEVNVPPKPGMFSFDAPEGYERVEKQPKNVDRYVLASAGSGKYRMAIRYAFAVDRLAVLVCWHHGVEGADGDPKADELVIPTVELTRSSATRECVLTDVRTQMFQDNLWHWSLAVPDDRRPLDPSESINLSFKYRRSLCSLAALPLRFDETSLSAILTRMQDAGETEKLALDEPFTLVRLRWQLARILARPADKPPAREAVPVSPAKSPE